MLLKKDPLIENSFAMQATRNGYGKALSELAESNPKIVVLDADLSKSTKTIEFQKKAPERFFNFGVAEQNLMGHAAGFAISGLIPYASTFAIFATGRAWEIVRNSIAYPNLNVKIVATHAGISLGEDGASHQIIEDIAIMRVIPNMKVIVPSDSVQAYYATLEALKKKSPVYIRLGRPNVPVIHQNKKCISWEKANTLINNNGDITFFTTGIVTYEAWKAMAILEQQKGWKINLVEFSVVKPIDKKTIIQFAKTSKIIFTIEEHNVMGGFGSAVAECIVEEQLCRIKRIGIQDEFGQTGSYKQLMQHYKLNAEGIVEQVEEALKS